MLTHFLAPLVHQRYRWWIQIAIDAILRFLLHWFSHRLSVCLIWEQPSIMHLNMENLSSCTNHLFNFAICYSKYMCKNSPAKALAYSRISMYLVPPPCIRASFFILTASTAVHPQEKIHGKVHAAICRVISTVSSMVLSILPHSAWGFPGGQIIPHGPLPYKLTPSQPTSVVLSPLLSHGHKKAASLSMKQFQPSAACFWLLLHIKQLKDTAYGMLSLKGTTLCIVK